MDAGADGRAPGGRAPAKDWLLLKAPDAYADGEEPVERAPESIFSGLTVEEIGGAARSGALDALRACARRRRTGRSSPEGSRSCSRRSPSGRRPDPAGSSRSSTTGCASSPSGTATGWRSTGRSGDDVTARYPEVARALRALPVSRFVLDGEIVASGEDGRPSFQRLQARCISRAPTTSMPHARRGARHAGSSSTAWPSRVGISGGGRSSSASGASSPGARPRRGPLLRARRRRRVRVLRGRSVSSVWRRRRQARGEQLRGRALPRLAQGEMPAPPGVRHRRATRAPRLARPFREPLHLGLTRRAPRRTCPRWVLGSTSGRADRDREAPGTAPPAPRRRSRPARP